MTIFGNDDFRNDDLYQASLASSARPFTPAITFEYELPAAVFATLPETNDRLDTYETDLSLMTMRYSLTLTLLTR